MATWFQREVSPNTRDDDSICKWGWSPLDLVSRQMYSTVARVGHSMDGLFFQSAQMQGSVVYCKAVYSTDIPAGRILSTQMKWFAVRLASLSVIVASASPGKYLNQTAASVERFNTKNPLNWRLIVLFDQFHYFYQSSVQNGSVVAKLTVNERT